MRELYKAKAQGLSFIGVPKNLSSPLPHLSTVDNRLGKWDQSPFLGKLHFNNRFPQLILINMTQDQAPNL